MRARRAGLAGVSFLCVYVREAHAADVWPIDGPHVLEPRSTEDRVKAAIKFLENSGLQWPLAVDGIDDAFLKAFDPWPFRFFVFRGSTLHLKTSPVEGTHRTDEVEAALRSFQAEASTDQ